MKPLRQAARSLRREARHAELLTLAAALVLAVAALGAVTTLASRIEAALLASSAELLGGDLGILARSPLPPAFDQQASAEGLARNHLADFPSVVFAGERSRLVDVRASDRAFPLRGTLRVRDAAGEVHAAHAPPPGEVLIESPVADALGVGPGDRLQLGDRDLAIAGIVAEAPDGGELFRFAPRVLMNLADAEAAGLLGAGSRVRHRLLLAGPPAAIGRYAAWARAHLPENGELTTLEDAQQNLRNTFERAEAFLRLGALLAALLAGIAIALAAQHFARRKLDEVALLRCLGAARGEILATLLAQLALLALPACLLGAALGLALQELVLALAAGLLPGTPPPLPFAPVLVAAVVGLAVLFGFALPPLLRLREVTPLRVLRHDLEPGARSFDAFYLLPLALGGLLIVLGAADLRLAGTLAAGFAGVALATLVFGLALLALVRRLARRLRGALRFGLANLARRGALSLLTVGALALGFTAVAILAAIGPSLLEHWRGRLPADTPNWFVINLQPGQRPAFEAELARLDATRVAILPLAAGKLLAINGRRPQAGDFADRRAGDWLQGEIRASWSAALPESNTVLEGRWLPARPEEPELSVDRSWQKMFELKLGDRLTLRLGERELTARITSFRGVQWDSFRPNFFLMLDAATGATLPHGLIASFHVDPSRNATLAALAREFPNLSLLDVNQILDRVRSIMDQVSRAVAWVLGFSLLAGFLVLAAALAATADERRRESALLRALGASRAQLGIASLAEFAALGTVAGSIAVVGASLLGSALASQVFKLEGYLPPLGSLVLVIAGASASIALLGWLGTLRLSRTSPMGVLRRSEG